MALTLASPAVDDLRLAFEGVSVVIFATDEAGRWTLLNPAWEKLSGHAVAASLGRVFLEFVHPDDRAENIARFEPLVRGEKDVCRHEVRYQCAEGSAIPVEVYACALRSPAGEFRGTVGTITEISARKLADKQLAEALAYAEALAAIARLSEVDESAVRVAALAVEACAAVLNLDYVGIATFEGDTVELSPAWHSPALAQGREQAALVEGHPCRERLVTAALSDRQALFSSRAGGECATPCPFAREGLAAVACLPAGGERAPASVLVAGRAAPLAWEERERAILTAIARVVAVSLERNEHLRQLELAALQDPLTGLGNRRAFEANLEAELAAATRYSYPVSLLMLDVDGLKRVNDSAGHARGDALLRAIAETIDHALRREDRLYRLGGDEFAVILDHTGVEAFPPLVRRMKEAIAGLRAADFPDADASLGVAAFPLEAATPGELMRLADERMYAFKASRYLAMVPAALDAESPRAVTPAPEVPDAGSSGSSGIAWRTLRGTLALLAGANVDESAWAPLLEAIVAGVPSAQAGSLDVLEGSKFRQVALVGYARLTAGALFSPEVQVRWYGLSREDYLAGRPRVMSGDEFRSRSTVNDPVGATAAVRCTLCVPVVLDGAVVAHINLDNFSDSRAFGPEDARIATEFAAQAAALLAAQARQRREAEHLRELEALVAINQALADARDEPSAERALARETLALLNTEDAVFMRLSCSGDELVSTVALGRWSDKPLTRPRGQGISWAAIAAGEVQVADDSGSDPRVFDHERCAGGPLLSVPLRSADGVLFGALAVSRGEHLPFTALEVRLARAIGAAAVTALDRIRATRAAADRAAEAERAREGALYSLGLALEARDFETHGHTQRVASLAVRTGEMMGLSLAEIEELRLGAYLHDIGKLGLSDAVLLKPGPLDAGERGQVERHSTLGSELAGAIPNLPPGALAVVRHHHERWDGCGYPDRLGGPAIPLLARIFAVADVYDALISERPYKHAWTHDDALAEIVRQSGSQFDPEVVAAFMRVMAVASADA